MSTINSSYFDELNLNEHCMPLIAKIESANDQQLSPVARGKRLKSLRKMADLSRNQIEQSYQISENTLRSWEEGKHTGLTEQGARRILIALRNEGVRCSIGWLLFGTGTPPQLSEKTLSFSENDSTKIPHSKIDPLSEELALFYKLHENAVSLQIQDDGMEPLFKPMDYVAGIRKFGEDITRLIGNNCIVETEMGEKYFRVLREGSQLGCYTLTCINPLTTLSKPTIYDIELVSAAPVIWHRLREFK